MLTMMFDRLLNIRLDIVLAFATTCILFLVIFLCSRRKRNFPPGPSMWQVIRCGKSLLKEFHIEAMKFKEIYGDVFSISIGPHTVVVLSSAASAKEALAKPEFQEKPPFLVNSLIGYKSTFFTKDTDVWMEQRKFVVQTLKDFGFGKSKMEEHLQVEVNYFIEFLQSHDGKPVEFNKVISLATTNNINTLVFGKRYEYDDPERDLLGENLQKFMKMMKMNRYLIPFPWIRHFPYIFKWMDSYEGINAFKQSSEICKQKIREHKEDFDPENIRDFIDSYLLEIQNKNKSGEKTTFTEETLIANLLDLFAASSETVRASLSWCIYVVAAYPEVQRKIQDEIHDLVGSVKRPELWDQKQMPFTNAVIMETMRWKTIFQLASFRVTCADTSVGGYDIPRGTFVVSNAWGIHHDPEHWTDPDTFKPERFLTPDGKSIQKHPSYRPFTSGKRKCPGEAMAYMTVFLYFVSILQKFDVRFPEGTVPTFENDSTFFQYRPASYTVQMVLK